MAYGGEVMRTIIGLTLMALVHINFTVVLPIRVAWPNWRGGIKVAFICNVVAFSTYGALIGLRILMKATQ